MSAREHLAQVLEGTGLYELTGSSPSGPRGPVPA